MSDFIFKKGNKVYFKTNQKDRYAGTFANRQWEDNWDFFQSKDALVVELECAKLGFFCMYSEGGHLNFVNKLAEDKYEVECKADQAPTYWNKEQTIKYLVQKDLYDIPVVS